VDVSGYVRPEERHDNDRVYNTKPNAAKNQPVEEEDGD